MGLSPVWSEPLLKQSSVLRPFGEVFRRKGRETRLKLWRTGIYLTTRSVDRGGEGGEAPCLPIAWCKHSQPTAAEDQQATSTTSPSAELAGTSTPLAKPLRYV